MAIESVVNGVINLLFGITQIAFWLALLWLVVRVFRVASRYLTVFDYAIAYEKGLWEKRSEETGIPLVWEKEKGNWRKELEGRLKKEK